MINIKWTDPSAEKVWNHLNNEVEKRYEYAMHRAKHSREEAYHAQREFLESTKLIRNTMAEFYRKYTTFVFTPEQ